MRHPRQEEPDNNPQNCLLLLWGTILCAFAFFFLIGLWHHQGFLSSINDIGCFDQAIWNCSQGSSLVNTSIFSEECHWFGLHFQPILYVFIPLYLLIPSANWLIICQALCLAIAAYPIFLVALHISKESRTSYIWSLTYLLNPFIISAALWDFHPSSIAVPIMAYSLLAVLKKKPYHLALYCLILLTIKEHYGISVFALGLLYWTQHKNIYFSAILSGAGLLTFIIVLGYIMPYFSVTGGQIMLSENQGQLSRYSWLGTNLPEILFFITANPFSVLKTIFISLKGLEYILTLLGLFFFIPLFSPLLLLPATADILANLLSSNMMPRAMASYHSAPLIPIFIISAINGTHKRTLFLIKRYTAQEVAIFCFLIATSFSAVQLLPQVNIWQPTKFIHSRDPRIKQINEIIGPMGLIAQANIGGHFSQRIQLVRYPQEIGSMPFIVLHLQSPTPYTSSQSPGRVGSLAHHLQMNPGQYLQSIIKLVNNSEYGISYYDHPWLVVQQGKTSSPDQQQRLNKQLQILENTWGLQDALIKQ